MHIFMTNGTRDYLKTIQARYANEEMILMDGNLSALLLHETSKQTKFNEPRRFEVMDSVGELNDHHGFFVMDHLPTTDEGRPIVEHRFNKRNRLVEQQPGFIAIRVLRPLKNNTYVILTMWENEIFYRTWKGSIAYEQANKQNAAEKNVGLETGVFASPAYVSTYVIRTDEDQNDTEHE